MDVSIIIVNYNTERYIKECLASIYKHVCDITFEVIIVDNRSKDGSLDEIAKLYPEVNILLLDENLGFGAANNRGAKVATGRNIFLLNPDTILINNAVKILSDLNNSDRRIGVCGGNLYGDDLTPAYSYSMFLPGIAFEINRLFINLINILKYGKNRNFNHTDQLREVAYISGADMMISKELYDETGGFDEDFFMYYEESELTCRIQKQGYKIISNPHAKIIHLEGKSFAHSDTRCKFMLISWHKYLEKIYKNKFVRDLCYVIYTLANINMLISSCILRKHELGKSLRYSLSNTFKIDKRSPYKL